MKKFSTMTRGFTLIELLVVISIIGLLSSIVLVALNGARAKGHDAVIIEEVHNLTNLMELEYQSSSPSTYQALQGYGGWWFNATGPCSSYQNTLNLNSDNYVTQAIQLCTAIYNNSTDDPGNAGYRMYWGINTGNTNLTYNKYYSIMVYLPGAKKWLCVGTSGTSQIGWAGWGIAPGDPGSSGDIGCYSNP